MHLRALLRRLWDQRRRIAPLFLVLGLILVAGNLSAGWPRQREVHYLLGEGLRGAREARISVGQDGETLHTLRLRLTDGADGPLVHRPTLAEGSYDVTVDLTYGDGRTVRRSRVLSVPFEGVMRFRLEADPKQ